MYPHSRVTTRHCVLSQNVSALTQPNGPVTTLLLLEPVQVILSARLVKYIITIGAIMQIKSQLLTLIDISQTQDI